MSMALQQATRHQVPIEGSVMQVLDIGEGEAVVLGGSYLWDAAMWQPQVEALARRYRVLVPELWGHGGSGPMPAATRDLDDLVRQHLTVLDRLGIGRFALAGLSVGGMWAAGLALEAPDRVRALALLDTFLGAEPEPARQRYFAMLAAVEAAAAIPPPVLDAVVPMFFAPGTPVSRPQLPGSFRERLAGWSRERILDSVVPLSRLIFGRRDRLPELGRLRMPRIVISGAEDIPRPPEEARRMAEAMGCPCLLVPEAGHISALEAPEVVAQHLARFLAASGIRPRGEAVPAAARPEG